MLRKALWCLQRAYQMLPEPRFPDVELLDQRACTLRFQGILPNFPPGCAWQFPCTLANTHSFILTTFIKAIFYKKICNSLITSEAEYADDCVSFMIKCLSKLFAHSYNDVFLFSFLIIFKSTFCIKSMNFFPIFICLLPHCFKEVVSGGSMDDAQMRKIQQEVCITTGLQR